MPLLFLLRFLSWRYWARHRGALALATLGVALGVAVFVAVQCANYSVLRAFSSSLEAVSGRANVQIVGGARGLPEGVYARLLQNPDARIQAAAPLIEKTLFSPTLKAKPQDAGTSLLILGIDPFAQADFFELDLQNALGSGAPASTYVASEDAQSRGASTPRSLRAVGEFLLRPDAIALSPSLAARFGLKSGSTLDLFVGSQRKTFRVVAIAEGVGEAFGGDFALVDLATAQEALGEEGRLSQIDLIVPEAQVPAFVRDWQRKIGGALPPDARVQRPAQRSAQVASLLAAFQLNLSALSGITLFVGAFLIYNTVAVAVVRRRVEAGILRATGTPSSRLTALFCIEAGILGLIGSLVGFALGLILARYTLGEVSRTVSTLYVAVRARDVFVPPWLFAAALAGGTLLSVAASFPAAREAGRVSPREAFNRASLNASATRFSKVLALIGLAMIGCGLLLCLPAIASRAAWVGFIATGATLGGFACFAPLAVLWGGALAQKSSKYLGVGPMLAGIALQRGAHRASLVVAALMVSLAMTVGLAVMVLSFRNTVARWVDNTISADFFVAPARGFSGDAGPGLPPEVVAFAKSLPQARAVDTIRGADTIIRNQPVFIAANTLPSLATGDRRIEWVSTRSGAANALRDFSSGSAILVSERFSNLLGYKAGQSVTLETPRGPRPFSIAGVFYDYTPNEAVVYLPQKLYKYLWSDGATDGLALYFRDGVRVEDVQAQFEQRFGRRYALTLLPNKQIREQVFKTFDDTFAVTYALQLIAVIVAGVGIFDTLLALLLERGRELAVLRATGASKAQVQRWILLEFGLVGLLGWALSLAAGSLLAWQLIFVINRQFFGWTIQPALPLFVPLQALVLALAAALGAGLIPSRAAARADLARSLQME
jgi:putative ABC transport system permease protein